MAQAVGAFQRFDEKQNNPELHLTYEDAQKIEEHRQSNNIELKPQLHIGSALYAQNPIDKLIHNHQIENTIKDNVQNENRGKTVNFEDLNNENSSEVCKEEDNIDCDCKQATAPKPILKHQLLDAMHATGGRQPPDQPDPSALAPVPNNLRPVSGELSKEPCYLPQPEDALPHPNDLEMGAIGPWATGRMDWGPLSGMTGTRPVVDKYTITRYSEGDWRHHNKEVINGALMDQHRATLTDWNARQCLEQTQTSTDKNQADNTKRLNQRELEVQRWKCELERAITAASEEIGLMEEQRRRLKQAGAVLTIPESISGECLSLRGSRIDGELVRDEVEEEVIKEVALCAEIRDIFTRTLKDIEKQLLEDKTAKQRLEYDWSDKKIAHEIDSISMALNNRSNILMFKPGAVCFPNEQSTPEDWEHFTRENLLEGEATRQRSVTLRGTIDAILNNAARDLRSQADRVELALSRRISCVQEVTHRLENELKQVLRKLADIEYLIGELRSAIRRMDTPMKKAQTRLDNRLYRPRVEFCRDAPHFGLVEEVKSIGESIAALQAQLNQSLASQDSLIKTRGNLEREIMLKRKTLEVDNNRFKRIRSFYPSATALSGYV